jgi:hypothetical protein
VKLIPWPASRRRHRLPAVPAAPVAGGPAGYPPAAGSGGSSAAMWIAGILAGLAAAFPVVGQAANPDGSPEHGDRDHGGQPGPGRRPAAPGRGAAVPAAAAAEGAAGR